MYVCQCIIFSKYGAMHIFDCRHMLLLRVCMPIYCVCYCECVCYSVCKDNRYRIMAALAPLKCMAVSSGVEMRF